MGLEYEINLANQYYLDNDIAVIYKKPIPITINKVDYPSRIEAVIREAYFKTPSTTDYNGIYKGKYIDFEAKETKNKTSFPLQNIHKHQIDHLNKVYNHGGIAFIIIRFTLLNKTFLLDAKKMIEYIKEHEVKSIPISFLEKEGYIIKDGYNPVVDYLSVVDKHYLGGIL
jgi:recombination protein U